MAHKNSGSALIYILVAIALIALLTASMMEPSNQQGQAQNQNAPGRGGDVDHAVLLKMLGSA